MKECLRLGLLLVILVCVSVPLGSEEILMPNASTTGNPSAAAVSPAWMASSIAKMQNELIAKYGSQEQLRIDRGLHQVAEFWRADDGDEAAFEEFVRANFAGDQATLDTMFNRFQSLLEQLDGHMHEINREFNQQSDLDLGPVLPFDEVFAGYDPSAHVLDDFFSNKLAFTVLLNFPLTTLDERLKDGPNVEPPAVGRGPPRAALRQAHPRRSESRHRPGRSRIRPVHRRNTTSGCITCSIAQGQRLFPPKMRLLSHWNLRDEIKADYSDAQNGLAKQRMIQQVMERIVTQTIPQVVINNPAVDWNPYTNEVKPAAVKDSDSTAPDTRADQQRARTRYALRHAAENIQRIEKGRSIFSDRAHADRPPLRGRSRDSGGAT